MTCNTAVGSLVWLKYGEFKSFPIVVYANLVLAHDLVETVLISCKICLIEILQDFTSWFQGLKDFLVYLLGASQYTQFTASGSPSDVKLHNFVDCYFSTLSRGCSWPWAGDLDWVLSARASWAQISWRQGWFSL